MISNLFLIITSLLTFTGKQINDSHVNRVETEQRRVKIMEDHCLPIHMLGPNPLPETLKLYREQCEPLRLYLQDRTTVSRKNSKHPASARRGETPAGNLPNTQ